MKKPVIKINLPGVTRVLTGLHFCKEVDILPLELVGANLVGARGQPVMGVNGANLELPPLLSAPLVGGPFRHLRDVPQSVKLKYGLVIVGGVLKRKYLGRTFFKKMK